MLTVEKQFQINKAMSCHHFLILNRLSAASLSLALEGAVGICLSLSLRVLLRKNVDPPAEDLRCTYRELSLGSSRVGRDWKTSSTKISGSVMRRWLYKCSALVASPSC